MKKILSVIAMLCSVAVTAQNVPNRGFELWENEFMFETLDTWFTSNQQFMGNNPNTTKSSDSYSGNYSVLLENAADSSFGFFYIGITSQNGPDGGIPYTAKFDSVTGWYKCDMKPGDTAMVMTFKYTATDTAMSIAQIYGTTGSWTRFSFPVDTMSQTEVFFGVVGTDPFGGTGFNPNSWIMIDDVAFVYSGSPQPTALNNNSFEIWDSISITEPVGWNSMNAISAITGDTMILQQTTDANSGNYAMKVQTVAFDSSFKSGWVFTGNAPQEPEGFTGGFPYDAVPTSFSGYYKYEPVGVDTAMIIIVGSEYDPVGDSSIYAFMQVSMLLATSTYTAFNIPISYDTSQFHIDTINIIAVTSNMLFDFPDSTSEGTTLFLDDFWIDSKCAYADTTDIFSSADTAVEYTPPAIPQFEVDSTYLSYSWITGDTTYSIVLASDTNNLTLTIEDQNNCMITDDVIVYAVNLCAYAATANLFSYADTTIEYTSPAIPQFEVNSTYLSYSWNTGDTTYSIVLASDTNNLILTVEDQNNCMITDNVIVYAVDTNSVGIEEYNIWGMEVFPNPATNVFNILIPNNTGQVSGINIYNSLGAMIRSFSVNGQKELEVDATDIKAGIYFIVIFEDEKAIGKARISIVK